MTKERCSKKVSSYGGISFTQCSRQGTIAENGKVYCKQHAPSLVEARRKARSAAWDAQWSKDRAIRNAQDKVADAKDAIVAEVVAVGLWPAELEARRTAYLRAKAALEELEGRK